jgi:PBP superfamily domain
VVTGERERRRAPSLVSEPGPGPRRCPPVCNLVATASLPVRKGHSARSSEGRNIGSGDTYAFTDYLSKVNPTFAKQVGNATLVNWPGGVGASGNAGIAGVISSTSGAIGYLIPNHLKVVSVQNAAGAFATPGLHGIAAAAAAFPTPTSTSSGVEMHLVCPPASAGKLAYPISTYTYIIVPASTAKATELRKFIFWALTVGIKKYGPKLIFVPTFPPKILSAAEKALKLVQCPSGGCS